MKRKPSRVTSRARRGGGQADRLAPLEGISPNIRWIHDGARCSHVEQDIFNLLPFSKNPAQAVFIHFYCRKRLAGANSLRNCSVAENRQRFRQRRRWSATSHKVVRVSFFRAVSHVDHYPDRKS